ncbi:MAG: DUF29 domain-containing protein [Thermosynechococcaceae cyanobacterium]
MTNYKRSRGWLGTIREARKNIVKLVKKEPSLKNHQESVLDECYQDAKGDASFETRLSLETFPVDCPYTMAQILDPNFPVDPLSEPE